MIMVNRLTVKEVVEKYCISRWSLFNIIKIIEADNDIQVVRSGSNIQYKSRPIKIIINKLDNDNKTLYKDFVRNGVKVSKLEDKDEIVDDGVNYTPKDVKYIKESKININKIDSDEIIDINQIDGYQELMDTIGKANILLGK